MTYGKKAIVLTATILGMTMGAAAQDQPKPVDENDKLLDPMTRAEIQCINLKKEAEKGSEADKKAAEKKCMDAIAWAKEMAAKKPAPKPVPNRG
ncbi:hypothetical protein [Kordiimonas aquimaris]|uniref:hypothetical protein n=1 Tax=Kordiimonas aquimaris TaxID=707591 RepID=UPI0021D21F8A|nr:hypothetical protein [Kordiimonas aquimaris]